MFNNILVVCHGNICRSPVGEALLRRHLPGHRISSAGIGALVDNGVDAQAAALASEEGLDVSQHRARQLTEHMIQEADLVLVMSQGQRKAIGEKYPAVMGKTMLFGQWVDDGQSDGAGKEIPDPFNKSRDVFVHVHGLLKQAAQAWADRLGQNSNSKTDKR